MFNTAPSPIVVASVLVVLIDLAIWMKLMLLKHESIRLNVEEHEDTDYEDRLADDIMRWTEVCVNAHGLTIGFNFGLIIGGYIK